MFFVAFQKKKFPGETGHGVSCPYKKDGYLEIHSKFPKRFWVIYVKAPPSMVPRASIRDADGRSK